MTWLIIHLLVLPLGIITLVLGGVALTCRAPTWQGGSGVDHATPGPVAVAEQRATITAFMAVARTTELAHRVQALERQMQGRPGELG